MSIDRALMKRAEQKCELCGSEEQLSAYALPPNNNGTAEKAIWACATCQSQFESTENLDVNHWRCLNDSMWSEVPAVQVMAYRQLHALTQAGEAWAQDLLDMLYLDEHALEWAQSGITEVDDDAIQHVDSNGTVLAAGDTVVLIKDLDVKGANFTAKRGTAVRNIGLTNNPEHIEGRVNGQRIVILTKFVKK